MIPALEPRPRRRASRSRRSSGRRTRSPDRGDGRDALDAPERRGDLAGRPRERRSVGADDDVRGCDLPGRERELEGPRAAHRLGVRPEAADQGEPRQRHEVPEREQAEQRNRRDESCERPALHPPADPSPDADRALARSRSGTNGQNARRPRTARTAGRSVSPAIIVIATPSASTGPAADVEAMLATRRTSMASVVVAPLERIAGDVRPRASAIAACVSSWRRSLLPKPGDQEERVVGAGAEHEDHEQPGRLPVDRQPRPGDEDVHEAGRDRVRDGDDGERDNRNERRAVDRDEQGEYEDG